MESSTSTGFIRLNSAKEEQARKEACLELLLSWFAYAFMLAGGGVILGLLYASGGSLSSLLESGRGALSFLIVTLFVIGGAVFLTRKTRAFAMPTGVSNHGPAAK